MRIRAYRWSSRFSVGMVQSEGNNSPRVYAAYHVKRLRKYLLIILLVAIPVTIADEVLFPMDKTASFEEFLQFLTLYYGVDTNHFVFSIATWAGTVLVAIYLVRRWSKQWNMQFDNPV